MTTLIGEEEFLGKYVTWALWVLAIIVCAATVTGLIESYNGLYVWFAMHGIAGFWADWAPLMVDSFTVIGELAIFSGISRHWEWKSRVLPWASALIGIGASVAGNVGDKIGHPLSWELTAAIPPLAGAFGIVVGLGVLKRVAKDHAKKQAAKEEARPMILKEIDGEQYQVPEDQPYPTIESALNYAKNVYGKDPLSLYVSPEGLKEVEQEPYQVPVQPYEAPVLKGLDALIPQEPAEVTPSPSLASYVQPTPETTAGTAEQPFASVRAGRQIIQPDGLDPAVTGAQPFTPEDVLNYKPS